MMKLLKDCFKKRFFNPATQGMVLSRKNIETDLPILENMAGTKSLPKESKTIKTMLLYLKSKD